MIIRMVSVKRQGDFFSGEMTANTGCRQRNLTAALFIVQEEV